MLERRATRRRVHAVPEPDLMYIALPLRALRGARLALAFALTSAFALVHPAAAADKAPEFTHTSASEWLNSEPLRLKNLRGKVVLIEFWAFDCVNCRRSVAWVHSVQERYRDRGLIVVGVHTPELPEERSIDNVRAAITSQKISYPVMVDGDYSYWQAMRNQYWPAFYVVDAQGRIAAHAIGEMHVNEPRAREFEQEIEGVLAAGAGRE
jgi:thiol-disulfide isomerase/thioredoxin